MEKIKTYIFFVSLVMKIGQTTFTAFYDPNPNPQMQI